MHPRRSPLLSSNARLPPPPSHLHTHTQQASDRRQLKGVRKQGKGARAECLRVNRFLVSSFVTPWGDGGGVGSDLTPPPSSSHGCQPAGLENRRTNIPMVEPISIHTTKIMAPCDECATLTLVLLEAGFCDVYGCSRKHPLAASLQQQIGVAGRHSKIRGTHRPLPRMQTVWQNAAPIRLSTICSNNEGALL